MPMYDMKCTKCGCVVEVLVDGFEAPAEPCTECGGQMVKVILKAPFIQFVGEGFYETEHGSQRHNVLGVPRSELDDVDDTSIHDIDPNEPDEWEIDL